jgi:FkbM family methyltransferase
MKQQAKKIIMKMLDMTELYSRLDTQTAKISELHMELINVKDQLQNIDGHTTNTRDTLLQTGPNEVLIKMFNGQKIYAALNDVSVAPHLAIDGIWEAEITHAWRSVVKSDSIVFDIGANFGYYGLLACELSDRKKSKIIYFEPNSNLIPFIHKTLAVNWAEEGSDIENIAISDKKGTATLSVLKDYIGSSSLHSVEHLKSYLDQSMTVEAESVVTVKTNTLDAYCEEKKILRADLIKLDVEGYEVQAYSGMRNIIKKSKDTILFIEFTSRSYDKPKEFFQLIKKDFKYVYAIEAGGAFKDLGMKSYNEVMEGVIDWVMLVFSKNSLPHNNYDA